MVLVCTAYDLKPFAVQLGYTGGKLASLLGCARGYVPTLRDFLYEVGTAFVLEFHHLAVDLQAKGVGAHTTAQPFRFVEDFGAWTDYLQAYCDDQGSSDEGSTPRATLKWWLDFTLLVALPIQALFDCLTACLVSWRRPSRTRPWNYGP